MASQETTSLTLPATPKQLSISTDWVEMREKLLADATGITVTDETGFQAASDILQRITKLSNQLERFRKDFTDPFLTAQRSIKAMADGARKPLEAVKTLLKGQLAEYAAKQREIEMQERREAERIAQEEAARVAEENAEARELLGDDAPVEEVSQPTAVIGRRAVSDSVRVKKRLTFEVVDVDKVPRAFLIVDDRLVNQFKREREELIIKAVEDGKAEDPIPGVRFAITTDVVSR